MSLQQMTNFVTRQVQVVWPSSRGSFMKKMGILWWRGSWRMKIFKIGPLGFWSIVIGSCHRKCSYIQTPWHASCEGCLPHRQEGREGWSLDNQTSRFSIRWRITIILHKCWFGSLFEKFLWRKYQVCSYDVYQQTTQYGRKLQASSSSGFCLFPLRPCWSNCCGMGFTSRCKLSQWGFAGYSWES